MNLHITCLSIALTLQMSSHACATTANEATLALQGQFPVCSDVLKEKQNPTGNTEGSDERLEGPELAKTLTRLKRRGADVNAYYAMGTPLHHAACAGWESESNWLLRNGADPLLKIQDHHLDALGVAVKTENLAVASSILKHYQRLLKAQNTSEKQQEQIHASVQAALQEGKAVANGALEKLLLSLRWQPSLQQWRHQFGELLCSRQPKAALELLKTKPWNNGVPRQLSDATWTCPIDPDDKVMNKKWLQEVDMPTWLALDAQLPTPVLLPLTTTLPKGREAQELQAAVARGLRAPWSGMDNATTYFKAVLSRRDTPAGAIPALLRLIPAEHLPLILNMPSGKTAPLYSESRLGGTALTRAHAWPVPDLEWLLKNLSPTIIKEVQLEVTRQWSYAEAEHWIALTPYLTAPLSVPNGYPSKLPYALWPRWKAMGAVPEEQSWSSWLGKYGVPLADLPQALPMAQAIKEVDPQSWPTDSDWAGLLLRAEPKNLPDFVAFVKTQRPELLPRFMDWALAPLSYGSTPDAVALQISRTPQRYIEGHWQRVRQLAALGFRSLHPRHLAHDVSDAARPAVPTIDEAVQKGWALSPPKLAQPSSTTNPMNVKWVVPQLTCRHVVDDALRRALANNQSAGDGRSEVPIWDYALPVQVTGLADCQWLFVGGLFGGSRTWIDQDFFEGKTEQRTGAADGSRAASFWNAGQKRWVDSGVVPTNGDLFNLHQSGQPAPWIAASGMSNMNVNPEENAGDTYQASLQLDGTAVLEPLPKAHPARVSLIAQCGGDLMLGDCKALKNVLGNVESDSQTEKGAIAAFADTYWPQEKQAFFAALLANDRPALNRMRDQGLFAHWLSEGLQALGKTSTVSLMDKRRRAAWVLAQTPRYDEGTLASLVSWLPPEDWRPIVKMLGCYPRNKLLELKAVKADQVLFTRLQGEMRRFSCQE